MIKINSVFDIVKEGYIRNQIEKNIVLSEDMPSGQLYAEKLIITDEIPTSYVATFTSQDKLNVSSNGEYVFFQGKNTSVINILKRNIDQYDLFCSISILTDLWTTPLSYISSPISITDDGTTMAFIAYKDYINCIVFILQKNNETYNVIQTIELNSYSRAVALSSNGTYLAVSIRTKTSSGFNCVLYKKGSNGQYTKISEYFSNEQDGLSFYNEEYLLANFTNPYCCKICSINNDTLNLQQTLNLNSDSSSSFGVIATNNMQYVVVSHYFGSTFFEKSGDSYVLSKFFTNNSGYTYIPSVSNSSKLICVNLVSYYPGASILEILPNGKLFLALSSFEDYHYYGGCSYISKENNILVLNQTNMNNTSDNKIKIFKIGHQNVPINDISDLKRCYRIGYTLESGRKGDTVKAMEIMKLEGLED